MPATPLIAAHHVSFQYQGQPVLHDISCTITAGEYIGIIGPNGGGKTTFLKILLGLLRPTTGSITLFSTPLQDFREWHYLGYVPQRVSSVDFPATVYEIARSGLTAQCTAAHLHTVDERTATFAALQSAGIEDLAYRRIGELSGGQQQRVYIARALCGQPRVLLLDEPATGIDPDSQERFYTLLADLQHRQHLTIIFVSHDIGTMTRYASRVLYLDRTLSSADTAPAAGRLHVAESSHRHH